MVRRHFKLIKSPEGPFPPAKQACMAASPGRDRFPGSWPPPPRTVRARQDGESSPRSRATNKKGLLMWDATLCARS